MMYIKWFILCIISFIVMFGAILLAPLAALFRKGDHLPKIFWWMETYDNPVTGEKAHWDRWEKVRKVCGNKFGLYLQTWGWLWRNKAYNFDYHVLGADITCPVKWHGDTNVNSDKNNPQFGSYYANDGDKYFCYWSYKPWLTIGKYSICTRIFIGWKFKGAYYRVPNKKDRCMLAMHINPFRHCINKSQ